MPVNIHAKASSVVVVVNDNLIQLQALSSLLARQGHEVRAFESATEALEDMRSAVPPDLIVTDLYMPGIDGWRFCRLLRSSEYALFNHVPILVVSATFSGEETSRITTDLGANAFLSSPVDSQELEKQVRKLLRGEQPQGFLRLLIVEDDSAQAEMLKEVFETHGYRADIALTGRDAETMALSQAYDVVVLDHHLPDIQGDELLLRLKPLWQDTVYLAMTGDPRPKLALEWTKLGAAAFVSKPFAPHYLIELCVKARRERDLTRVADRLEVRAREFRQSEEQHRHLLQHLQAGVVVHAPDTSVLLANQEASRLLGLSLEQMQGKVVTDSAWRLVRDNGSRMPAHEYPVMQVLASLRPVTNLVVGVDRPGGGERIWVLVNAFPESDELQQLRQVVVTFVDITERKRAEAALEVERLQFQHLFEQSPVATWLEDLTAVGQWMQHLRDQGVVDLRAFLQEQPDQIRHAVSLIRVLDMNLAAVAQNAAQSKQHLEESLPRLFEALTYEDFLAELDAIWQGQDCIEFESHGRRLDGRSLVLILRLSIPTRGGRPDLSRVVVTGTDITERRQSEEAIRQVRADLEKAQSVAHIGSWISRSPDKGTLIWSAEAHRIFGVVPSEFDGRVGSFLEYVHPEDRTCVAALAEAAWRGEQQYNLDHRIVRPDGLVRWVHEQADIERDASGQPVRMIGVVQDVTERRQAEELLRAANAYNRSLLEASLDPMLAIGSAGKITDVNTATEAATGLSRAELIGSSFFDYFTEPDKARAGYEQAFREGVVRDYSLELYHLDGHVTPVLCNAAVYRDERGKVIGVFAATRDITEIRRNEDIQAARLRLMGLAQTHSMADLLQATLDEAEVLTGSQVGFFHFLEEDQKTLVLRGWSTNTKQKMCQAEPAGKHYPVDEAGVWADCIRQRRPIIHNDYASLPNRKGLPPGHATVIRELVVPVLRNGRIMTVLGVGNKAIDYTEADIKAVSRLADLGWEIVERKRVEEERERLQAQLTQAQKMESVGRLAGGVAHDFNNMLTVIQGNAALAMQDLPPDSPLRENLEEIQKCTERSADLTRQLLAFARRQTIAPKVLDLNTTVERMLKMLQRLIGENIDLAWLPAADLWPVKIDPSQVDQVLANLCVNARDAVGSVGQITLETGNFTFDEAYCATHTGFVPGDFVLLAVGDNGCGMEKDVLAHVFEPFFTTKGVGKGTGLGLATVYGIVKQNDGFINVHSEKGHGTTIKAYLPRHAGKTGQNPMGPATQPIRRGHETVLLVEDEPAILKMGAQILKNLGYAVLVAATPGEAIRLAQEQRGEIHLLVTDVIMPEMNGRDLADQLLGLYPAIKRLYMSGYTANVIAHHGVLDEGIHFMQKPFSFEDLAEKVRQALDD